METVDQSTFTWYEQSASARAHHESIGNVRDALSCLRRHHLAKVGWENRNPGTRLAPSIEILRNAYGFEIAGNGSAKAPYRLLDPRQWPSKVRVNEEIKEAYYSSTHWAGVQGVRARRWDVDGYRCVLCTERREQQIQCHHVIYRLFEESLDELMTVCVYHHQLIHDNCRMGFPIGVPLSIADRLVGYHEFEEWLRP